MAAPDEDGQETVVFTSVAAPRICCSTVSAPYTDMAEVVPTLPLETLWPPFPARQLGGFWVHERMLRDGLPALHARFSPRHNDVLLASFPKSGTTWLKALAFATMRRDAHSPSDAAT